MSALSPDRMRQTFDRQVKRIGMRVTLRRATGDRWAWAFFSQWNPRELMGGLIDPLDRLLVVSALGLTIPPDHAVDRVITWQQPYNELRPVQDENLRIMKQAERVAPAGVVIFWKLSVRR